MIDFVLTCVCVLLLLMVIFDIACIVLMAKRKMQRKRSKRGSKYEP
jgi:hypothetical protein